MANDVNANEQQLIEIAEEYYDSMDADQFYFYVWGGEDIHVGIYNDENEAIKEASRRSVENLANVLKPTSSDMILDLGAGYGGAARYLAQEYGCKVSCLNLSEVQNKRNRDITAEQGLSNLVEVIHGAFESLPYEDESFDHAWSQDAFLHSGNKKKIFEEAFRILKPGGKLVFTDPMQADGLEDQEALKFVLARIHLDKMGSFALYKQLAEEAGFEFLGSEVMTQHLTRHYSRVLAELQKRREELVPSLVSENYFSRMCEGLEHWIHAGKNNALAWGIIELRKPDHR